MPDTSHDARTLRWRSPAKVNLCLRIVGRRADGYHLLDSVFVPIDLCDTIDVTIADVARGVPSRITVACNRDDVPADASNLAARAAAAVLAEGGLGARVHLAIAKAIPPGSGLGGGSGDAGTTLRRLAVALGLAIPEARLAQLALALGADVPFFLVGRPARVRGVGEAIEPIAALADLDLVVAIPPVAVSTAWAFRAFAASGPAPAPGEEPARLAAGAPPSAPLLVNDLERVVLPAFPVIAEVKACMLAAGALAAVMSGSGSAVAAVARSRSAATDVGRAVEQALPGVRAYVVRTTGQPSG